MRGQPRAPIPQRWPITPFGGLPPSQVGSGGSLPQPPPVHENRTFSQGPYFGGFEAAAAQTK